MLQKPIVCPLDPQKKLWMNCYLVYKTPLHTPGCRLQGGEGTENCTGGGGTPQEGKMVSSLLHALMLSKLSFTMTQHT
jgi:hypothetical protein